MANLSDAYGTITVQRVGKEFLKFLNEVQGSDDDAYYKLCEVQDFENAKVDKNGDMSFDFSTFGRWNYGSNLEGYLDGAWLTDEKQSKAYTKFTEALAKKDGVVVVEYSDCDPSMDWMGKGVAQLEMVEGSVIFSEDFNENQLDVSEYAKQNGMTITEAFETLHGEEPAAEYEKYINKCKDEGKEPKNPQVWYDEDFEWEV